MSDYTDWQAKLDAVPMYSDEWFTIRNEKPGCFVGSLEGKPIGKAWNNETSSLEVIEE